MKYFMIAGEASGDLHAGALIDKIKIYDSDAKFCFLGGDKMQMAAGVAPLVHYKNMAFMGFINVILNIFKILKIRRIAKKQAIEFAPDKVILVDYPGFNLNFAKFVKKNIPMAEVCYYISPKLWAWKSYRIKSIKRYVDRMFTIFPFETEFYARYNYKVHYVGNPTVDSVSSFKSEGLDKVKYLLENGFDERPIILLLPGSRRQEIKKCLPKLVRIAELITRCQVVVAAAPNIPVTLYKSMLPENVIVMYESTYKLLSVADLAVVNSGTATLETALFDVPQLVVYHVPLPSITMELKEMFIKTKYISLVNIIAGKEVVKELIGADFNLSNLYDDLLDMLHIPSLVDDIMDGYTEIAQMLGEPGAADRCAKMIVNNEK